MENHEQILTKRTKLGDFSERWRPSPIHSIHWGKEEEEEELVVVVVGIDLNLR